MGNKLFDKNTTMVDHHNSWAWEILSLPKKERNKAMRIMDAWIDDEIRHLFKNITDADSFVKATWIYLLEHLPVPELAEKNNPMNDDYPYIESPSDAVYYYVNFVDPNFDNEQIGMAFLQLMFDGYIMPKVSKLIYEAKSKNPVKSINVSLRDNSLENTSLFNRQTDIDKLVTANNEYKKHIEHFHEVIGELKSLRDTYNNIYELESCNLAIDKCYPNEEILELRNSCSLAEDEELSNTRIELGNRISSEKEDADSYYKAVRFCKEHNLILPFEEKIIANGTSEEKRLVVLQCLVRKKLYR